MNTIYLQLGSNLGDRNLYLQKAIQQINRNIGKIIAESETYESSPWGVNNQRDFLNKVISVKSNLTAIQVLTLSQKIEKKLGRKHEGKWSERMIDIDILFYNKDRIETDNLNIPHPLIQDRLFVLVPLSDIASDFIHPIYNKNISTLLLECKDIEIVQKYAV